MQRFFSLFRGTNHTTERLNRYTDPRNLQPTPKEEPAPDYDDIDREFYTEGCGD